MVLHTLNASPGSNAFQDCLRLAASGDAIVLLGDGVYAALTAADTGLLIATGADIALLAPDAAAAGVPCPQGINTIDYDGLVTLSEQYPRQLAWF